MIDAGRSRILSLIEDWIILGNSTFQSKNVKITKEEGKVIEIKARKVISEITVSANGEITARGRVVAVQMPEKMLRDNS